MIHKFYRFLLRVLILLFFVTDVFSQELGFEWGNVTGGPGIDNAIGIVSDEMGNVYVAGNYVDTVDFDPGTGTQLYSSIGQSLYVQKFDPLGNFIWVKKFEATNSITGQFMTIDRWNNIYITGNFNDTVDFDPGPGSNNLVTQSYYGCAFLVKLDSSGNLIWAKNHDSTQWGKSRGNYMCTDDIGNIYLSGDYFKTVDFNPGMNSVLLTSNNMSLDIYLEKFNVNGDLVWVKSIGGPLLDSGNDVKLGRSGAIYFATQYNDTVDFDPSPVNTYNLSSNGLNEYGILKLDSSGNFIWAKSIGGKNHDLGMSIIIDSMENIYSCGMFSDTVDFDPGPGVDYYISDNSSAYVQKIDSSGNYKWTKTFNGNSLFYYGTIQKENSLCFVGHYSDTLFIDTGTDTMIMTSRGVNDVFMLMLDTSGAFKWGKTIGGIEYDDAVFVYSDTLGNVYFTGTYGDSIDLDPGSNSNVVESKGSRDVFYIKLHACQQVEVCDTIISCSPYTWIDGNTYDSTNNSIYYVGETNYGCDSIVHLSLLLNNVDTSVVRIGDSLMAVSSVMQYQWLNCLDNFSPITGATNQFFVPQNGGEYAIEIMNNGCTDTSSCYFVQFENILEELNGEEVMIYPNPNNGKINVYIENPNNAQLRILGIGGRVIYKKENIITQKSEINYVGESGVYFIEVTLQGEKKYYKIIHQ